MTWSLLIVLLAWQPPAAATGQPPVTEPAATQPAPTVTYDHGPWRGEVVALFDARYWYAEQDRGGRESRLQMQVRVAGERVAEVVRYGNVVFDEAVDDTGQALLAPDAYTEQERTETRLIRWPVDRLRNEGLRLPASVGSPNRTARTLTLRGSVRLIVAAEQVEITVDNPLQFAGKIIDHPRLRELGIEVRMVTPEELGSGAQPISREPALEFVKGEEQIHSVSFHDAWMRPIRHRERPTQTTEGKAVIAYGLPGGKLDEDSQLVLKVFPKIEDVRVPINIDALRLP